MASPTAPPYYYSSTAPTMTLVAPATSTATTLVVDVVAGLPGTTPFKLVLDPGLSGEEIVKVTSVSGNTLTVIRGWDGTPAQSHANLAIVRHMVTAEDLRLAREHESSFRDVHGVNGSVVGTSDTQTLINKDLSSTTNAFPPSLATDAEVAAAVGTHAALTKTHGITGAVVGTTDTQTLTNKTISGATNTLSNIPKTAITGLTGALVDTGSTQTLTGKTISGAANTLANIPESAVTNLVSDLNFLSTQLAALAADSGIVTTAFASAAGFSPATAQIRKLGKVVTLYVRVDRTGPTLAGSGSGDVTNVPVGTLTAGWAPAMPTAGTVVANGAAYSGFVWTDGVVSISNFPAGADLANGAQVSLAFTYLLS